MLSTLMRTRPLRGVVALGGRALVVVDVLGRLVDGDLGAAVEPGHVRSAVHLREQRLLVVDGRSIAGPHEVLRLLFLVAEPLGDRPICVTHG
ncbi:hypothetical protein KJK32_16870 [Streptomyces sp. JCM17656]|nr:hypothetical protein KJK32_16870 [Streptomyces sp. JCM17656]